MIGVAKQEVNGSYRKVVRADPGTSKSPNREGGFARTSVGAGEDSAAGTPLGRRDDAFEAGVMLPASIKKSDNSSCSLGNACVTALSVFDTNALAAFGLIRDSSRYWNFLETSSPIPCSPVSRHNAFRKYKSHSCWEVEVDISKFSMVIDWKQSSENFSSTPRKTLFSCNCRRESPS